MLARWSDLPTIQRSRVVDLLRHARASADANTTTAIDAALERLVVRRRASHAPTKPPVHRLTHHLSLNGSFATTAIGEIASAVRQAGTILAAATALGVTVRTVHRWQAQYPDLAAAIREAQST